MLDAEEPNLVLKLIRSRFLFFFFFYSTLFLLLLLGQKLCPVAGVLLFSKSVGTSRNLGILMLQCQFFVLLSPPYSPKSTDLKRARPRQSERGESVNVLVP